MTGKQIVTIRNESDVVMARMQVRDLARSIGMTLKDQACISLAASSLAQALGLGTLLLGQMAFECWRHEERTGVRVVCQEKNGNKPEPAPATFDNTRWMVDEFYCETSPLNVFQVTMIKWRS